MQVKRLDLIALLKRLEFGVDDSRLAAGISDFSFTGKSIVSYNSQVYMSVPFDLDFKCAVNAPDLLSVLERMKNEEISMELVKGELKLIAPKERAGIPDRFEYSYPQLQDVETLATSTDTWNPLPEDFLPAVKLCLFSVSRDLTKKELTCLYSTGDRMYSSDDLRITEYTMNSKIEDLLLQGSLMDELIRYPVTKYHKTVPWTFFKTEEGMIYGVRNYISEKGYPDIIGGGYFAVTGVDVTLPPQLKDIIIEVSTILFDTKVGVDKRGSSDILDKVVEICLKNDIIECRAESEHGWFEKDVSVELPLAKETKFIMNPTFFSQVLDRCQNMTLSENVALFKSEKFRHVVALPVK